MQRRCHSTGCGRELKASCISCAMTSTAFFDFVTTRVVPGSGAYGIPPMVMYRDWRHSFWHDDPTDLKEQEKYRRRFERFKNLQTEFGELESRNTLLFVRSVHCFDELKLTDELLQELMHRFGPTVKLLLIVPSQRNLDGPVLIAGRENLLVYCLETKAFIGTDAPFVGAVDCACDWALGKAIQANVIPHINDLMTMAARWHPCTMGGLEAFEPLPTSEHPAQQPPTNRGSSNVPSAVLKPRCIVPPQMMPPPMVQAHLMPVPATFNGYPNSSRAPSLPRGSLASAPVQSLRCMAPTPRGTMVHTTAHTGSAPTNPYHSQHGAMRCFEQAYGPPGARTPAAPPPLLRPPLPQPQRHPSSFPQRPQPSLS